MIKDDEVYRIGRLGKPHGVAGEITFRFDDDVFDRTDADYLVLGIDGILVPFFMEEYRFHGSETALVKFCDIDTQQRAAELTGCDVYFPRSLSDSGEGDVQQAELVGYDIVDGNTGRRIGKIATIDTSTANTLFELDNGALIPVQDELVEAVDMESKTLRMRLPEGLADIWTSQQ